MLTLRGSSILRQRGPSYTCTITRISFGSMVLLAALQYRAIEPKTHANSMLFQRGSCICYNAGFYFTS